MAKTLPLKTIRLLQGLDDRQLQLIENAGESREYEVGETIFEEGTEGTHIYCILDGRVEISLKLGDATDQAPVHTGTPGSVFGEFILFEKTTRSATARAVKTVKIFAITAEALRGIFSEHPEIGYAVMDNLCRILVGRVSKTTQELRSSLMW